MKGVLFRPEMITAITRGAKTQTRRLINPQPFIRDGVIRWTPETGIDINLTDHSDLAIPFARYNIGEVVYIKEAWALHEWILPNVLHDDLWIFIDFKGDGQPCSAMRVRYRFPEWPKGFDKSHRVRNGKGEWQSPMFLKERFARYFIKILDVQACRTRDITPEDCEAEGIRASLGFTNRWTCDAFPHLIFTTPQAAYFYLYDSINGKGAHERNFDWKYTFKLVPAALEQTEGER